MNKIVIALVIFCAINCLSAQQTGNRLATAEAFEKWCKISEGKEVLLVRKELNWKDAQTYCTERNARLATFGFSKELEDRNKKCFGNLKLGTKLWIGLKEDDENCWNWAHLYNTEPIKMHAEHNERCGIIALNSVSPVGNFKFGQRAANCEEKRPFICERMQDICDEDSESRHYGYIKDPNSDTFYLPLKLKAEYDNAQIQCNVMSANLPSIMDRREQNYFYQTFRNTDTSISDRIWLDAQYYDARQKGICWNLYYDFTYSNFKAFEGRCASFVKSNGDWISDLCEKRFSVVCQRRCSREPQVGRCFTEVTNWQDVLEK